MILLLIKAIVSGIMLGMVYALIGIGLNIIYGVMRVVNFAHGEYLMLAAYITYWLSVSYGLKPLTSLHVIIPVFIISGIVMYYITVPRLLKSEDPEMASYLAYFGIALIISTGALVTIVFPAITPAMGSPYTIKAFVVIVLGGLGNPIGAIAGGLIFGLVENISAVFIPTALSPVIAFIILIIVVMIKPQGLLARA
ncbi:hypothetical protein ES703_99971 [subsurface metagenome]